MKSNKKLTISNLLTAAIITTIITLLCTATVYIRGIEDNAEAVAWVILFFGMLEYHLINKITI